MHEVFVGAEGLAAGAEELLDTLLRTRPRTPWPTSAGSRTPAGQGRYHNARYRDVAREVGLTCTSRRRDGWAETGLDDPARARYAQQVARLDRAIGGHRVARPSRGRGRASNNNGMALTCGCGRRIRVAPATGALGPIVCVLCRQAFE